MGRRQRSYLLVVLAVVLSFSLLGSHKQARQLSVLLDSDGIPLHHPTICLKSTYGRNFNMVITLANAIDYATKLDGVVVLASREWDMFFNVWFARASTLPRVHRRPKGFQCDINHDAETHYFSRMMSLTNDIEPFLGPYRPQFNYLSLRESVLERGRVALDSYRKSPGDPVVTVHQRWLEGECFDRHSNGTGCFGNTQYNFTCEYTAAVVDQHLPQEYRNATIVLLGDGQRKDVENTFKHIDKNPFPVQAAMMVESDYHFGNPVSSVDGVIAHWRKGKKQFPEPCYDEIVTSAAAATL